MSWVRSQRAIPTRAAPARWEPPIRPRDGRAAPTRNAPARTTRAPIDADDGRRTRLSSSRSPTMTRTGKPIQKTTAGPEGGGGGGGGGGDEPGGGGGGARALEEDEGAQEAGDQGGPVGPDEGRGER